MVKNALIFMIGVAVCGCTSNREWGGKWQQINRLDNVPHALSLRPLREFHATPVDRTLKGVLDRWAHEAGMRLNWQLEEDYTLTRPITMVRDADLSQALRHLNAIYAAQNISLSVERGSIIAAAKPAVLEMGAP